MVVDDATTIVAAKRLPVLASYQFSPSADKNTPEAAVPIIANNASPEHQQIDFGVYATGIPLTAVGPHVAIPSSEIQMFGSVVLGEIIT
jgi:hypothetical protein